MRIRAKVDSASAERRLAQLAKNGEDLHPLAEEVFDRLEDAEADQFRTGKGWAKLKPATVKRKAKAGNPQPATPLVATGALRASLTRRNDPRAVRRETADSIFFSTRNPVANIHKGAKGTRASGLPKRNPLPLRVLTRRGIKSDVEQHFSR